MQSEHDEQERAFFMESSTPKEWPSSMKDENSVDGDVTWGGKETEQENETKVSLSKIGTGNKICAIPPD